MLRTAVYSLADTLGYVAGDPAGRVATALPHFKAIFEVLFLRLSTLQAAARAEAGYLAGSDRGIIMASAQLDDTDAAVASDIHLALAGRIVALNARTAEARFQATTKAQAAAQLTKGKKKDDP
eukprot:SAG31_NODE_12198_length_959_cov_1.561628_1_plen_123_part_00